MVSIRCKMAMKEELKNLGLHYSSVAHLSHQFKKITGLTPSYFKSLKHKKRSTLENV